jgi:hypothetical protein
LGEEYRSWSSSWRFLHFPDTSSLTYKHRTLLNDICRSRSYCYLIAQRAIDNKKGIFWFNKRT